MIKRINELEKLGEVIERGEPAEVLYGLGEGRNRTELLVTYIDGSRRITDRIASPPLIKLYGNNGAVSMDITDSDENADRYAYRNLRPLGAVFEQPTHPPYELGDLEIDLGEGKKLGISQYAREEYSPLEHFHSV